MIGNHPIETTISRMDVSGSRSVLIHTDLYLVILEYLSQQIAEIKLMKNTRCYYLEDTVAGPLCKEIRIDSFMVDFPASHVVHMVDFPASHVSFHGVILTTLLFWAPFSCNLELLVPKNSQSKMHSFLAPNKSQVNSHQRVEGQECTRCDLLALIFFGWIWRLLDSDQKSQRKFRVRIFCEMIRDSPFKV